MRDLAATLTQDAHWDGEGLVAEAEVIGPYRELVTDPVFTRSVGMSIRAAAETSVGEAEGRQGVIIDRLTEGLSVDLVTRAGRGGSVLQVLESARAAVAEATPDEVRDALTRAVAADPTRRGYVRDHDPDEHAAYVHQYEAEGEGDLHAVPYAYDGTTATLDWANARPVRAVTRYEPLDGDDTPQTTQQQDGQPGGVGQRPCGPHTHTERSDGREVHPGGSPRTRLVRHSAGQEVVGGSPGERLSATMCQQRDEGDHRGRDTHQRRCEPEDQRAHRLRDEAALQDGGGRGLW